MTMKRKLFFAAFAVVALTAYVGCSGSSNSPVAQVEKMEKPTQVQAAASAKSAEHEHKAGAHGGFIAEIGKDNFHAEAIFGKEGILKIYILGKDETRIQEVETQTLPAHVQADGETEGAEVELQPVPQPGDTKGKTSMFMGKLPKDYWGKAMTLTIPISIGGDRFRFRLTNKTDGHTDDPMPVSVSCEMLKDLYLTPGGKYTEADIEANGRAIARDKYKGIVSAHNMRPKSGDKVCPVTKTKSNPKFTWIIDGKPYEFCCPPCIDEFVQMAKEKPEEVKQPETYTQK
jgi:hypothetical protein